MSKFEEILKELGTLDLRGMYGQDFLLTWDKSMEELGRVFAVADALRNLRSGNISTRF